MRAAAEMRQANAVPKQKGLYLDKAKVGRAADKVH